MTLLGIIILTLCVVPLACAQPPCSEEGAIRLVDGGLYYGRVEVCSDGVWGKLCHEATTQEIALVVCRQLRIPVIPENIALFSLDDMDPPQSIAFDQLVCTGSEQRLIDCTEVDEVNPLCPPLGIICAPDITACCLVDCGPNSQCVDTGTTVADTTCSCIDGYARNPDTGECENINECETANNVCANGQCTDTEGGFCCDCDFGFVHGDDGTTCVAGECTSDFMCPRGRECVENDGVFTCEQRPRTRTSHPGTHTHTHTHTHTSHPGTPRPLTRNSHPITSPLPFPITRTRTRTSRPITSPLPFPITRTRTRTSRPITSPLPFPITRTRTSRPITSPLPHTHTRTRDRTTRTRTRDRHTF